MARKALIVKALKTPKYSSRTVRRCAVCGRSHAYIRYFAMCRICVRELAIAGNLNGFFKSSK
jgi:small subunit ribosomal protein S14